MAGGLPGVDRQQRPLSAPGRPVGVGGEAWEAVEAEGDPGPVLGGPRPDLGLGQSAAGAGEGVGGVAEDDGLLEPDRRVGVGGGGADPHLGRVGPGGVEGERGPGHGLGDLGAEAGRVG